MEWPSVGVGGGRMGEGGFREDYAFFWYSSRSFELASCLVGKNRLFCVLMDFESVLGVGETVTLIAG